jgi:hypothetical protein
MKKYLNTISNKLKQNPYDKNLHNLYMSKKKEYRKLLKRQQRAHKDTILKQLSSDFLNNPTDFWKLLDSLRNNDSETTTNAENITMPEWVEHFKSISLKSDKHKFDKYLPEFLRLENGPANKIFDNLNEPITISEIKKVIKNLKNKKASGYDMISNEMIKTGQNILLPAFAKLFNAILTSHCFPTQWNLSAISPLHKKGSVFDTDNYRGISITSCLGKVFTSILTNRLIVCIEQHNVIDDKQAAFKKKSRTSDHMFVLKGLINKYCTKKKEKLYTCFVDFRKAFDSVWREGLLFKLLKLGIGGNFYWLLKHMYHNTNTCIKLNTGLSDTFKTNLGIRQGDCLSPILFNLFINDLGNLFNNETEPPFMGNIPVNYLLYADDLVLISKSKEGLQKCLDKLYNYASTWNLEINTKKTNVVIFNKLRKKEKHLFHLGDTQIKTTNDYPYLGIMFEENCSFKQATADLKAKATKATFSLLSSLSSNNYIDIKLYMDLFDKLIKPIALYGSEIWLPNQFSKLIKSEIKNCDGIPFERLHSMFCKSVLGVYKSTSNNLIRQELKRVPLICAAFIHIVKYWSHILSKQKNSLLYQTYLSELDIKSDWIKSVEYILTLCDLHLHWENQTPIIENATFISIKDKLRSLFTLPNTNNETDSLIRFDNNYLSFKIPLYMRKCISRLRLKSNRLEIVRGRYARPSVPRENRICQSCNLKVDDEIHFLTECPTLADIRLTLYGQLNNIDPNFTTKSDKDKAMYIMNPSTPEIAIAVGNFIYKSKQLRNF